MVQIPPIVERELREALNKRQAVKTRLTIAAITVATTFLWLAIGSMAGAKNLGKSLSFFLFVLALGVVILQPFLWTADVLSIERRNRTLGLLFLAGLTSFEVFLGKFLSTVMVLFSNLFAVLQLFAIQFLLGGIPLGEFMATICFLPNLLLLVVSLSLLASALNEDEGSALVVAVVMGCLLCFATPAVYFGAQFFSSATLSSQWLILSPAYGAWMIATHFRVGSGHEFWASAGWTFLYSALALFVAAWTLGRNWQKWEAEHEAPGLWRRFIHRLLPKIAFSRQIQRLWLERSPAACLITHDPRTLTMAWMLTVGIVIVWTVCFAVWGKQWLVPWVSIGTAVLLNSCTVALAAYSGSRRIAEDRRSGVLEVLLTTPLSVNEVVAGLGNGIVWQFKQIFGVVGGINILLLVAGLWAKHWRWMMILDYFLLWGVVLSIAFMAFQSARWTVIWVGLNTGRATYSMLKPLSPLAFVAFQLVFHGSTLAGVAIHFPTGSILETCVTGGVLVVAATLFCAREDRMAVAKLKKYLRFIARQQLPEPADPRFKAWDYRKPFPCTRDDPEPQIQDFC